MMIDFCSDKRLLATAYVPLEDFACAKDTAKAAIETGAKALLVPSWCPQNHNNFIGMMGEGLPPELRRAVDSIGF